LIARDRVAAVLAYLNARVANVSRTGWVVSTCPFATWTHAQGVDRNPSFGVSVDEGVEHSRRQVYNCFSCQKTGLFEDLPFNLRDFYRENPKGKRPNFGQALQIIVAEDDHDLDLDNIPDYDEPVVDPDQIVVWPEWYLESFKSVFSFPQAIEYLKTRQITSDVIRGLDLRFDSSRDRVAFPIRDFDGRLVGLHGRHIGEHPVRYYAYGFEGRRNRSPWVGEQWLDFDLPVLLVESVFDLASVLRVYRNAACGLSAGLSDKKIQRVEGAVQYVTLYDYGTGGDRARERLSSVLSAPVTHLIPSEDQNDPGAMTEEEVFRILVGRLPRVGTVSG
jgi:hypothetical protein